LDNDQEDLTNAQFPMLNCHPRGPQRFCFFSDEH
jgi:hypothetical protein